MKQSRLATLRRSACASLMVLGAASAWADKPEFAGQHGRGHHGQSGWEMHEGRGHRDEEGGGQPHWRADDRTRGNPHERRAPRLEPGPGHYFGDAHWRSVHDYYTPRLSAGRCPPGLAKKDNGCMPPGQARQWAIGQPLPGGLVRYPLPAELRVRLGVPPAGYEFVRIAGDILLIAVGTSMVVDAIEDLGAR
jgi:Ni/Co efflux regulator RcnB